MITRSVVRGCGSYLPERRVTNDDLAKTLETSDDWISSRTGIRARHLAAPDEMTSDLAVNAARDALTDAGLDPADIDLIVLATSTPDQTFPASATTVQAKLGCTPGGAAFDVQAVCSGFVYALSVADALLRTGAHRRALVIGAETFSRIIDWEDRGTAVLFADGAGALVLEAAQVKGTPADQGVLDTRLHADGRYNGELYVDGGVSSTQTTGKLRMNGREVFRHAVHNISSVIEETLEQTGLTVADVDWFVPHQANRRILDATAKRLGIPDDKVVLTVQDHANTSAASIPLALHAAVSDGRVQSGDLVLMEAMGGGFTWGACLVRW
ncbi:MAG: beta-ketoacyl-ACP synthase III [Pseudomonadota bacterium]